MIELPVTDMNGFRRRCRETGPLSPDENERIFETVYAPGPRRALRPPLQQYGLGAARVLDVGCDYGQGLIHFGPGSMGIEVHATAADFAQGIGLPVLRGDLLDQGPANQIPAETFDAVWCYAVLEHLSAPHSALMFFRSRLKDDGLLFLGLPMMPVSRIFEPYARLISRLVHGRPMPMSYTAADHVNSFTPKTVRFMVERAGFEVTRQAGFVSARPLVNRAYNLLAGPARDVVVTVARKMTEWDYPPGSTRTLTADGWGFKTDYTDGASADEFHQ
ncbi:MAG: class I SAM-dependent methyltransferase [Proteobacteria bacterium]|nr:class I SAM-dependent methyltransferase [Pseudomonadota bacterium]MBU1741767.1 class I SAM-dependent methyltransferase [Pseudomonadota bacterium]